MSRAIRRYRYRRSLAWTNDQMAHIDAHHDEESGQVFGVQRWSHRQLAMHLRAGTLQWSDGDNHPNPNNPPHDE